MRMRLKGPRAAQMAAGANTSVLSLSDDLLNSRARRSGLGTRVGSRPGTGGVLRAVSGSSTKRRGVDTMVVMVSSRSASNSPRFAAHGVLSGPCARRPLCRAAEYKQRLGLVRRPRQALVDPRAQNATSMESFPALGCSRHHT